MTAREILLAKEERARELAGEKGFLNRKEFAEIADIHVSGVSDIIRSPGFGKVLKKKTDGGKGPVKIPLAAVLEYIHKNFSIE